MNLLFVADGRSQIALNWIRYFTETDHEVHLVSTYPCTPELRLASLTIIPVGGSELAGSQPSTTSGQRARLRKLVPVGVRTALRQWLGPLTLPGAARRLRAVVEHTRPDAIHAMRIPFEGMLATQANLTQGKIELPPVVISVWGNDFTLHATVNPRLARLTRQALARADALHTDCFRDQRAAREWGFVAKKPAIVLPGNGGIDLEIFYPHTDPSSIQTGAKDEGQIVINPRGIRAYVRNDTFFRAIPLVLTHKPYVRFLCPWMMEESQALRWVNDLGIGHAVDLLPRQTRPQMAELFRRAQVAVSLTEHDGTPNTLLEAMACGCYPVAGDIESIREWIIPGVNGSLVAPNDPAQTAQAILGALEVDAKREVAAVNNIQIVRQRAEYLTCMAQAEAFYRSLR